MQAHSIQNSLFNRYPKSTISVILALLLIISLLGLEWVAGHLLGLGKVVIYEASPIYGYRVAPNQHVARNAHQRVLINNLGLRTNSDWPILSDSPSTQSQSTQSQSQSIQSQSTSNFRLPSAASDSSHKSRILFIGDSVTYGGSYIDNEALFSEIIGRALPNCQTGNAGVNGWGVDNVVAFIKDTNFLHADVYVLMFPEGDFYRGLARIGGQPFWTRKPHFALEELWQYGIYKAHLIKTPNLHAYENSPSEKRLIAELAVQHLKSAMDYLNTHDKKVLVYISPSLPQVLGKAEPDPILKALFAQYRIPAVYLLDRATSLSEQDKTAMYHDVIHLSEKGHAVWAEWMMSDLNGC